MERILEYIAIFDGKIEDNLKYYGFSTRICNLLKKEFGLVKADGEPLFVVDEVRKGQKLELIIKETPAASIEKYDYPVNIIYDDEDIAVIDKPCGLATIATSAHYGKSLMNALANVWGDFVFHPVNRLDKGTSGLMLVAKHQLAHSLLSSVIAEDGSGKKVKREYVAIVEGELTGDGVIEAPIDYIDKSTYRRVVAYSGKYAKTYYKSLYTGSDYSVVQFNLATGRTHQIRVHSAHIGHPLAGDELYGGSIDKISRPALHSKTIEFTHPISGEFMRFECDYPDDMRKLIEEYWDIY